MSLRARLLAELNRPWRKDPLPVAVMTLAYTGPGSCVLTITEGTLAVDGRDGADSFILALEACAYQALGEAFAHHAHFLVTLTSGWEAVSAATLLDEVRRPITAQPATLFAWTSPNWRILEPIRRALVEASARIDIGLAQLNLLRAAGDFADYWGRFTSTVRRQPVVSLITDGLMRVDPGSPVVLTDNGAQAALFDAAGGPGVESTIFNGATLAIAGATVTVAGYQPKFGSGADSSKLILTEPFVADGPPATYRPYVLTLPAERDEAYTARQLRELIRPRANNIALATAITEDTGVPVTEVRDLRRRVFTVNGPLLGRPLAGTRYNTATAEVVLDGAPTRAVVYAAQQHAAAGIHVLVRGAMRITKASKSDTEVVTHLPLVIGTVPAMKIGVGAIGRAKIGPP